MSPVLFENVARLPAPDDNIAIATTLLDAGTQITYNGSMITLSHTVLLGHRFAVKPLNTGDALLSWGQTFGVAVKPIAAGDYVCNADVLAELRRRSIDITLPDEPNFQNDLEQYHFDKNTFTPAPPLPRYAGMRTFMGYAREGGRGVGTRNIIVLIGTTALTASFVRALESRLQAKAPLYPNIDGIVAVAHTEGSDVQTNNQDLLLRTLAGFIVHPNVGAALVVDSTHTAFNNDLLRDYMRDNNYPVQDMPHHFMRLSAAFEDDLQAAENIVEGWLDTVNAAPRSPQPVSTLKIALQCGGSDAFSGISGNPLAAWVAKEVIQYGGSANLAETDELIGAETYVLDKVKDAATAQKFLSFVERFKQRVAWHGHSADGNPSGGNKFRGLYNIYLKSLGAATKRHPDVRLENVIDYSERMQESGFYFMDSPGNDLESIAGQVASGCSMIFFVTGNGSITNFPFVPTIKIVTTSERYNLLAEDMDINAGLYLDGTPLDQLGQETFEYTLKVASGAHSVGEKAGHSQVQIWRNWRQTHPVNLQILRHRPLEGQPIPIDTRIEIPQISIPVMRDGDTSRITSDLVGLILPTSLCSGQIARMCVEALNKHPMLADWPISRFVTLVHTEGCGGSVNDEYRDTLLGYLSHPFVKHAILLEHGCEATHNDYFRHAMQERGLHPEDYGWASIQLEGGIHRVIQNMVTWFTTKLAETPDVETSDVETSDVETVTADLSAVRLALITDAARSAAAPSTSTIAALALLTRMIIAAGGTVVLHEHDPLLKTDFSHQLGLKSGVEPDLAYAQHIQHSGFHIMAMPTRVWSEQLTGIGAAGVEIMLAYRQQGVLPGHPMIPTLQINDEPSSGGDGSSTDLTLSGLPQEQVNQLLEKIVAALSHEYVPVSMRSGNINFQITRGLLGVSL